MLVDTVRARSRNGSSNKYRLFSSSGGVCIYDIARGRWNVGKVTKSPSKMIIQTRVKKKKREIRPFATILREEIVITRAKRLRPRPLFGNRAFIRVYTTYRQERVFVPLQISSTGSRGLKNASVSPRIENPRPPTTSHRDFRNRNGGARPIIARHVLRRARVAPVSALANARVLFKHPPSARIS